MRTLFTALLLCAIKFTAAQQPYTVENIPDSLKQDVNAVYFLDETYFRLESSSSMQVREHRIVTILNREGRRHGAVQVPVDKFIKLDEAEVIVFDATGKQVEKYRKKDFRLYGGNDGISLATDNKVYDLDFPVPGYPHTVEISYTINMKGYVDIPPFFFGARDASFLVSRLLVETETGNNIQFKTYNFQQKPVVTNNGSGTIYQWELTNKKKPYTEPGCYGAEVTMPWVDVAPLTFSYDGYAGSLQNWKELGKMFYPFYEEANPFPPERKAFFQSIAAGGKTQKEKIELLYKYLQNETRYVSIQFGIGGFKPFPVSFAEEKKYGDCKGLTHYMKNILQAVAIKSYAAIINAGSNSYPVDPSFAGNRFNHVILCVPGDKDTTWLECTSKQTRPGILSNFTENRYALLLTEDGGKLVRTPASKPEHNIWNNHTTVELYDDGDAVLHSRLFVTGEFKEIVHNYMLNKTKDDLKKVLVGYFRYKNPDDLEMKLAGDSAGGYIIELALAYSKYYEFKAGSKHFFPMYTYGFNDEDIKSSPQRKFDYLFNYPYIKADYTVIKLPPSFVKETIPAAKDISNKFLNYKNEITADDAARQLKIATQLTLNTHFIPAADFNGVAGAMEDIKKVEGQKIVLKKE